MPPKERKSRKKGKKDNKPELVCVTPDEEGRGFGRVVHDVRHSDDIAQAVIDRLKLWSPGLEALPLLYLLKSDQMTSSFLPGAVTSTVYEYLNSETGVHSSLK